MKTKPKANSKKDTQTTEATFEGKRPPKSGKREAPPHVLAGIPRLFFLANELRSPLPASLVKYLPQGEIIQSIASFGLSGVEVGLGLSRPQVEALIAQGSGDGKPTQEEFRYLVSHYLTEAVVEQKESMPLPDFMKKMDAISRWSNGSAALIDVAEGEFTGEGSTFEKWMTGFQPFDTIFEGFYQGLFMILGSTGTGKTTHMLALAEQLRRTNMASEIWFFQTEIPQEMFKYRMKPMTERTHFIPGKDRIFYGLQSVPEIIEMVKSNPDPNRIIFHDSPDVLAGGSADDGRRFELENIFRDFVVLKSLVKAVWVASQVRRKDRVIKVTSSAESWAKAWYVDGMIGLQKMGFKDNMVNMTANVVKNRFGPVDFAINYNFDQANIKAVMSPSSRKRASGWGDDEEDDADGW